jgi:uncharacterized protein YndB with AHSA1/START domain
MSQADAPSPAEAITIRKEFVVDAPPGEVWSALHDVGALHTRLAIGFVVDTRMEGDDRIVTFANGMVARERILAIEEDIQRVTYSVISDRLSFHRATAQVSPEDGGRSRFVWTTLLAPAELADGIETMMEAGGVAMKQTLEAAASAA